MSDEPTTDPVEAPQEPAAATPEPPKPSPPASKSPDKPKVAVWDDPETARAEIERLRRENGDARYKVKNADEAIERARTDLTQQIGQALGLVSKDEPVDPSVLAERAAADQAAALQAKIELAVYKAAPAAGADPSALTDSASFLAKVATLDPSDADAISAAIKAAVETNPRLAATPAAPRLPAPNPAQGASGAGAPGELSIDQQIAEAQKAGDHKRVMALKSQQLLAIKPGA